MSSSRARRTTAGVVFLTLFLDLVGFSIIFPLFPKMLQHYLATEGHAGFLGSVHLDSGLALAR